MAFNKKPIENQKSWIDGSGLYKNKKSRGTHISKSLAHLKTWAKSLLAMYSAFILAFTTALGKGLGKAWSFSKLSSWLFVRTSSSPSNNVSSNIIPLKEKRKKTLQFYTIIYLFFILGLPLAALFKSAGTALFEDFWEVSTSPFAIAAYSYTLSMALFAAIFNGIFGLLLAWVLVRYNFWGRRTLDSAVDLPFALPTSVAGLTLANLYSEKTLLGKFLYDQGFVILFTPIAVGLAMIFVSFPFVVRTVKPVLENIEKELEEAAWSLGAGSFTTFIKIIFPPIKPALITGITLAFSRAVGEYGSIVVVSSNIPEKDLITSVLIFQNLEQYSHRSAAIIGTVMLFLSLILLFLINIFGFINNRR